MPSQIVFLTEEQEEFVREEMANDPTIRKLAEKYDTTPESAALNFALSQVARNRYGTSIE